MWEAYLFHVTSGQIGPRIHPEQAKWNIGLNNTEQISLTLKKSDLPKVELGYWLQPWYSGVLLMWKGRPIVAGPLISRPTESYREVGLECGGIRSVLARRILVVEQKDWLKLPKSKLTWSGVSLGTIAKRVVAQAQIKPGGKLPISYPIADQAANHTRTYKGFDLSNLNADQILTKLANVINGPDIVFRPRLLQDNLLTFDMYHGTEGHPRISQAIHPVWDTRPVAGSVSNMRLTQTGAYQTNRVYSVGAGQNEGTIIRLASNFTSTTKGFPFLETVFSSNSENKTVVASHATAQLNANLDPLLEIEMHVRADGHVELGQFWPGMLTTVVTDNWVGLPDGDNKMRLLACSGDLTNDVMINLQLDADFAERDTIEQG
jgi:hypothetical protein